MQDEIWHQFGIQNYNGNVLSVYSVAVGTTSKIRTALDKMLIGLVLTGCNDTYKALFFMPLCACGHKFSVAYWCQQVTPFNSEQLEGIPLFKVFPFLP